ncbi:MAG: anthranilate synthase component I family protein [Firmicutes bacterium]|nr:anthranilate synthase component I family protein [Bacillota bacterium]
MKKQIDIINKITIEDIIEIFKDEDYFFMLESNKRNDSQSNYTYIGIKPLDYMIIKSGGLQAINKLNDFYEKYRKGIEELTFPSFFSFLTYDLGMTFLDVKSRFDYTSKIPLGFLGYYPVVIVENIKENKFSIYFDHLHEEYALEIYNKIEDYMTINKKLVKNIYIITYHEIYNEYKKKIKTIKDYIYEGDVYQINYTRRFSGVLENINYNEMYLKLRNTNPAPFSAFIRHHDWAILSSSPERLIKSKSGVLETRPIKGTIDKGKNIITDFMKKRKLKTSEKDKSELLMIVDLERNDLSRVSKSGSVRVKELFKLETYETVHHLVSTIESEIEIGLSPFDVLYRLFPGGSITGTPKKRAVEIIDELEEFPRGLYTGAIGYINSDGDFDFNIAIRTIITEGNHFNYNVGGGITWKSDSNSEFLETEHKGLGLRRSLDLEL